LSRTIIVNEIEKHPVWILWEINRITNKKQIRGLYLWEDLGKHSMKALKVEADVLDKSCRFMLEKSYLNHLFGASMYEL